MGNKNSNIKLGDVNKLRAKLEKKVQKKPNDETAHKQLGFLLQHKFDDYQQARYHFKKAVELKPNDDLAHLYLGDILLYHFKDHEAAKIQYEQVLDLNPMNDAALNNLAYLNQIHLQDYDAAIALYEQALDVNPKYSIAHNNLGRILLDQKNDYETAQYHIERAIQLDGKLAAAHANLGRLYHKGYNDNESALDSFQTALSLNPTSANVNNNFGEVLEDLGDLDGALESYQTALGHDPDNQIAQKNLDRLLGKLQNEEVRKSMAPDKMPIPMPSPAGARSTNVSVVMDDDDGQGDMAFVAMMSSSVSNRSFLPSMLLGSTDVDDADMFDDEDEVQATYNGPTAPFSTTQSTTFQQYIPLTSQVYRDNPDEVGNAFATDGDDDEKQEEQFNVANEFAVPANVAAPRTKTVSQEVSGIVPLPAPVEPAPAPEPETEKRPKSMSDAKVDLEAEMVKAETEESSIGSPGPSRSTIQGIDERSRKLQEENLVLMAKMKKLEEDVKRKETEKNSFKRKLMVCALFIVYILLLVYKEYFIYIAGTAVFGAIIYIIVVRSQDRAGVGKMRKKKEQ